MKTGRKGTRSPSLPVITLLTDFGTADYFVGAVKGVILSLNPLAVIADITHDIPPQDIEAGAFALLASYRAFPVKTIHVAVVDPGVGSARRPIVLVAGDHLFVGPDNGIFSYIYENEQSHQTFHVTAEKYFRQSLSSTFHGRDLFAPIAAALSLGIKPDNFGPMIVDEIRLPPLAPLRQKNGRVRARIIHIDRFGNCITNITRKTLTSDKENTTTLLIKGKLVRSFKTFFSDANPSRDQLFAIWGSAGFLEIAVNNGSAARMLAVKRGETVILETK